MFTIRDYSSDEIYDLGKFMNFRGDVYDVLDCPFLYRLKNLPTVGYYYVNNEYEGIDQIAYDVYRDVSLFYYIQYYNNNFNEVFYFGDKLNLFSSDDLAEIYYDLSNGVIDG